MSDLILYHRTTRRNAAAILENGFRDGEGNYMTDSWFHGVWVSDTPLDINEGAKGDALLEVRLSVCEEDLAYYEWVEEGKPYREWLVPAHLLNTKGSISAVDGDLE